MKPYRFLYTPLTGLPEGMPFVDLQLSRNDRRISVSALIDSGCALNILPFDVGLELGFTWEKQTFPPDVTGVLKGTQAYAVLVQAALAPFPSLDLAFAWVSMPSTDVRVLLGQVNFFKEYNVYFYGHQHAFEIVPRAS